MEAKLTLVERSGGVFSMPSISPNVEHVHVLNIQMANAPFQSRPSSRAVVQA